jgi:NAD(P)H-dependent flavin oxidoreductase YrpB (nitropropane dioxygenase family)
MRSTRLCKTLGIAHPIISAPMGPDLSGVELVAAVSGAGGLGILQAQRESATSLKEQLRQIRASTDKPFGVNLVLQFPSEALFEVCLEERVPVLSFFWGDPSPYVKRAHRAGLHVIHQAGSIEEASAAAAAGVDAVIAQGWEAGGHGRSQVSTLVLVPTLVDALRPLPVIAAGGIADARGVVAMLALGAEAVVLGTRFLASTEARAHPDYKRRLVQATAEGTARTMVFGQGWPNAPYRTLLTPFVAEWLGDEPRCQASGSDEPVIGRTRIAGQELPVRRFMGLPPNVEASGQLDAMALAAGQCVGLVRDIRRAADIVRDLVVESEQITAALGARA